MKYRSYDSHISDVHQYLVKQNSLEEFQSELVEYSYKVLEGEMGKDYLDSSTYIQVLPLQGLEAQGESVVTWNPCAAEEAADVQGWVTQV